MKVKVCGMKSSENIKNIQNCRPDFMGFIFYNKSPRYVSEISALSSVDRSEHMKTVGVFVNDTMEQVVNIVTENKLDFIQLHGDESINYTKMLSDAHPQIIKAFKIDNGFDWSITNAYAPYVQYFLFDTPSELYGGSGTKFNWSQLKSYQGETPFFLSGGITIADIGEIMELKQPQPFAIDVNSGFEIEPGLKSVELIKKLIKEINYER